MPAAAGGLAVYELLKAAMWLADWPRVWDLVTDADHAIYMQQAARVLAGGPMYPAFELSGPFTVHQLPVLYPPVTVWGLIVPMSLLPAVLWWLVPALAVAWSLWRTRPDRLGWLLVLLCLLPERSWVAVAAGNPAIWCTAAVALAVHGRPWAYAGVLLKPTLAPIALLGVRSRGWWACAGLALAASLLMLPAWADYLRALRNFQSPGGLLYSLDNVPLVLLPLAATITTARSPRGRGSRS